MADVKFPQPLSNEAFRGLAGDVVKLIEPESEAHPAALLSQFLVAFGNMVGKGPYFPVGSTKHHTNFYLAIVGDTSSGRKGTAWDNIRAIFERVDPLWVKNCRKSGFGSGEAVISVVSDSAETESPSKPKDKRLLIVEPEFARHIKSCQREGSTLSPIQRDAWDGGDLQAHVRDKDRCLYSTAPHISMIGHCTREELNRIITTTDISNGNLNRFCWISSKRTKLVPIPKQIAEQDLDDLSTLIKQSAEFAKAQGQIERTADADEYWKELYALLNVELLGIQGALAARAAPMVLRLAMVYALLDHSSKIDVAHLEAAHSVWEYSAASAAYIFGKSTGDKAADKILNALETAQDGLTKTQIISAVFGGNAKVEFIDHTLKWLRDSGYIQCVTLDAGPAGRKAERWQLKSNAPDHSSNSSFVTRKHNTFSFKNTENEYA